MSIAIVPTLARAPIAATPGEATIRETSAPAGARVGEDFASILLGLPVSLAEVPSPTSQEGNRLEVDSLLLRLPLALSAIVWLLPNAVGPLAPSS